MNLNDLKVFCVNLDERKDRWEETQEEVKNFGIEVERFPAIKHKRGHTGCIMSHMKLWRKAKDLGIWMVIEDDIMFLENARENLEKAISQLPEDWSALYLTATLNQPLERVSDNLLRLKRGWTTCGIIWNNQNGIVDYIIENHNANKVDVFLSDVVQEKYRCFLAFPMPATQRPGHSDIVNRHTDYKAILNRYERYVLNRD